MDTQTYTDRMQAALDRMGELEVRIDKGAAVLGSPAHAGKDDEKTLAYESAWRTLCHEWALAYDELLRLWKESGTAIQWTFPAGAPIALTQARWSRSPNEDLDWVPEPDGTLSAWMTYAEFRLALIAVTTEDDVPHTLIPPTPREPAPVPVPLPVTPVARMERLL